MTKQELKAKADAILAKAGHKTNGEAKAAVVVKRAAKKPAFDASNKPAKPVKRAIGRAANKDANGKYRPVNKTGKSDRDGRIARDIADTSYALKDDVLWPAEDGSYDCLNGRRGARTHAIHVCLWAAYKRNEALTAGQVASEAGVDVPGPHLNTMFNRGYLKRPGEHKLGKGYLLSVEAVDAIKAAGGLKKK